MIFTPSAPLSRLLRQPIRWKDEFDRTAGVEMNRLELEPNARALYVEFANAIERELIPAGELATVKAFASKLPENAARIAGVLTLIANPDAWTIKAEVLGDLCERVRFDPDVAKQLHESLYKQARRGGMCCSPACMRKRGCLTALRLRCCRSSAACWRRRSCPRRTTPSSSACSGCCASSRWACAGLRAPACLAQRASMAHC